MRQPPRPQEDEDRGPGTASQLGEYAGFGLTIAGATALFAWLGTVLDGWLHTKPLFVLLGTFLGFAAGFYNMYSRLVPRGSKRPATGPDRDGTEGAESEPEVRM